MSDIWYQARIPLVVLQGVIVGLQYSQKSSTSGFSTTVVDGFDV